MQFIVHAIMITEQPTIALAKFDVGPSMCNDACNPSQI